MEEEQRVQLVNLLKMVYPFRLLDDEEDLGWIVDAAGVLDFEQGQAVYHPGEPAEMLYMVAEGQVNLNRPLGGQNNESLGLLKTGDLFGLEIAGPAGIYLLEAFAVLDSRLLCWSRETLNALLDSRPELTLPFQMMARSLGMSIKNPMAWRGNDETIHYIDRRHPIFLLGRLFLPVIAFFGGLTVLAYLAVTGEPGTLLAGFLSGLVMLASGLLGLWNYADWENDFSVITNKRVIFQEKVILLYDTRLEAPMDAVLSQKIESSQLGRIIGYGNVIMKTYTGTIAFPDVRHPEVVVGLVEERVKKLGLHNYEEQKKVLREQIRRRLGFIPPLPLKAKEALPTNRPIPFKEWLGRLFIMKWESGSSITYRTHLAILLVRLFLPTAAIIGTIILIALVGFGALPLVSSGPAFLVGGLVLLIVGFWWWYQYEDWANDVYIVNDEQVIDVYKKPLGFEEKRAADLKNIQSVSFTQNNFINLLFNYGDIRIRVGDTEFTFDDITRPSEVQNELFRRIDRKKSDEKRKQDEELHRHLIDLAESYHKVIGDPYSQVEEKKGL